VHIGSSEKRGAARQARIVGGTTVGMAVNAPDAQLVLRTIVPAARREIVGFGVRSGETVLTGALPRQAANLLANVLTFEPEIGLARIHVHLWLDLGLKGGKNWKTHISI